jgi:hypothetical protein
MRIKYKHPYWAKYVWDLSEHHDNQYVTKFDKEKNQNIHDFQSREKYIVTCEFMIKEDYKKDKICMVFGKPGKNMGLSYNTETNDVALEFWSTNNEGVDVFNYVHFKDVSKEDVENGVVLSYTRKNNKFILYKNFAEINDYIFEGQLIEDYKIDGLYFGCSSPDCSVIHQRYYGEMDLKYFSIIEKTSDINDAKDLYESKSSLLVDKYYYEDIICLYDFETINNLDIIYDESKNNNFLEKVPLQYVKF